MTDKKRILIVSQEMKPYTSISDLSAIVNQYAQHLQDSGLEVRILMPRFGTINERRHRLHEVVRLSGMNITVDDEDYPLIIKVASLPGTRMQVYFLDNEEFFKRKFMFNDDSGKFYDDNAQRMIFFCKGVVETVKKFGWAPDIVHLHGWMTAMLPALLKTSYVNEPVFRESSIVYSAYENNAINEYLNAEFKSRCTENGFEDVMEHYINNGQLDLNKGASHFSDGSVVGDPEVNMDSLSEPCLDYSTELSERNINFYEELMELTQ